MLSYKNFILMFGQIRKVFLSSYINIILSFGLIGTAFLSRYKNIVLIFGVIRTAFVIFCFSLYKMVDNRYSQDNYKSLKISIEAITKKFKNAKICS